jgi:pimeloyl-ACP methyl ester carboxylesterase
MQLLKDDVLLGSEVNASAIAPLEGEIKGDPILSSASDTRSASQLGASSSFISTFDGLSGQVGTIDPSAKFTQISSTFSFSDIAVAKDGTIFGITTTQLYKINPVSGLTTVVGDLSAGVVNMNALEFANDVLYAAGDSSLYTINTTNGAASLIANLDPGFISSGDLAFDAPNNRFLATSKGFTSDSLYGVSLTGQATKIGDIGFSNILALMFEGEKLFGFTADGARIAINPGTGVGVFDANVKGISDRIGGASGLQIKKGEILSSTPGTILSADTIDVFLPPGGEITLDITVTVPGDASSSTTRSALSVESVDTVAAQMPSSSAVSASATTDQLPLDVFLLQDLSGSFEEDLPIVQKLVPNLVSRLQSIQPNTTFGVGSFIDKPISPFGNLANGTYVYRTNLPLTTNTTALQSTVNNFIIRKGGDGPEAQLEGLLQTALRSQSEIGFRDSARRVAVVATDAPFHQAGDGSEARITNPNNLDAILDGNPPGTGEDYPSVPQVREALINANIVPVFAVTRNQIATYRDLVDNSDGDGLGFGSVVELESDSSNLVDAIATGLDVVGREINVVPVSDDFGYVKEITPSKFTDVLPGQKLTFRVKLKSDGKGGDDTLNLRALGFGDTKINIRTERVPNNLQREVDADFSLSPINNLLKTGIDTTLNGIVAGRIKLEELLDPVTIQVDPLINNVTTLLNDASTSLKNSPYGTLRQDFKVGDKSIVENPAKRLIDIQYVLPNDSKPVSQTPSEQDQTWLVVHGWNDGPDGKVFNLAQSLANVKKNDRVLFLNWQQASYNGKENKDVLDLFAALKGGNVIAAQWIRPVAEKTVEVLESLGIDANKASQSLNLIGHSLGSLLSAEIGSIYKQKQGSQGTGVKTLTALDPASLGILNLQTLGLGNYDVDGRNDKSDAPQRFDQVADFSRAFVGSKSLAGNQTFASQAEESFQMDFGVGLRSPATEHGWVVDAFRNLIENPGIIGEHLLDSKPFVDDTIKVDAYGLSALLGNVHEGVLALNAPKGVEALPEPILLVQKNKSGNDDDIVYGTFIDNVGNNKLDGSNIFGLIGGNPLFTGSGNDKIFGDSGNDEINGDSGDDTLDGGAGNDTLIGGDGLFDSGKDILEGGDGDDIIRGGGNVDILTGGTGSDRLDGGDGDDVLFGGLDKEQDTLIGGLGKSLFLLAPGTGLPITDQANRDKVDIIEDFRAGLIALFGRTGDIRGISSIGLSNGLSISQIDVEIFGTVPFEQPKTAIKANGEYLAVIKGEWLNKDDLRLVEIPT